MKPRILLNKSCSKIARNQDQPEQLVTSHLRFCILILFFAAVAESAARGGEAAEANPAPDRAVDAGTDAVATKQVR